MKKILSIMFVVCITVCLAGCVKEPIESKNEINLNTVATNSEIELKEPIASNNEIKLKELTQEQEDLINLLFVDDILFFDYKTEEAYKNVEFWLEIYENGVLIDRPVSIYSFNNEAKPCNGQLSVLITNNKNSGFQWTFVINEDNTQKPHTGVLNADHDTTGRSYGPIDEPVTIESGKEIVLYTSIFSNGGMPVYNDTQMFVEQPELLNEYPYVHIIKCKFK